MAKKVYHTLTYLMAVTSHDHKTTLQEDLEGLLNDLDTVEKREVEYDKKTLSGIKFERITEGLFLLRIAASVHGEKASTIPNTGKDENSLEMDEIDPPDGYDFADGDLLCLIDGNKIYVCQSSMRDDMLYHYLKRLFKKNEMDITDIHWNLDFVHKISLDKIEHIKNNGIKSIELNAFANASELIGYSARKDGNFLERFFKNDSTLHDNVRESSAKVSLTIRRTRFGSNYEWLEKEAETVLSSSNSQYVIITGDNIKITPSDMVVHKKSLFTPFGKSVLLSEGIERLMEFRDDIAKKS